MDKLVGVIFYNSRFLYISEFVFNYLAILIVFYKQRNKLLLKFFVYIKLYFMLGFAKFYLLFAALLYRKYIL